MTRKDAVELKRPARSNASSGIEPSIEKSAARRGALHIFPSVGKGAPDKKGDGNHSDGGGLILQVKGESKRWYFRYTTGKKTSYVPIGALADRSLKEARKLAGEYRNMLADNLDPKAELERRAAAARGADAAASEQAQRDQATLEVVARAYHAAHLADWTAKHGAQWLTSLEGHVFPKLGARPVADIKPAELLDVLQPLRVKLPETGTRVRERLDVIFADAMVRGLCEQNPAAAIATSMRRKRGERKRTRKHFAAMSPAAVPAFIATLRASDRVGIAVALAFEFLILTASRTAEVLGATWGEIDEEQRTWTIAANRMKSAEAHTVYLTARTLAILREARKLRATDAEGNHSPRDVVFPSPQRATKPLSNMAFLTALTRLGLRGEKVPEAERVTAHGFRASFSTWANEQHFPRDVIEAALAHNEPNAVRAAYNRAEYLSARKRLAEAWADHCEGRASKRKGLRVVGSAA